MSYRPGRSEAASAKAAVTTTERRSALKLALTIHYKGILYGQRRVRLQLVFAVSAEIQLSGPGRSVRAPGTQAPGPKGGDDYFRSGDAGTGAVLHDISKGRVGS
jgi:hypothetical protein